MNIQIRPVAIAVAFFFAYVLPTIVLFMLGGLGIAGSDTGTYSATWLSLLLMASYVVCPVTGGYLAARLGKQKSYTHALIVSVIAGVALGLMYERYSIQSTLMWIIVFSAGGIVGAWIYRGHLKGNRPNAI